MNNEVFWLDTNALAKLQANLARLEKKFGQVCTLTLGVPELKKVGYLDAEVTLVYNLMTMLTPCSMDNVYLGVPGFELVAKFETEVGLLYELPGKHCPIEFRGMEPTRCDQCGVNHHRKSIYIIHNTDTDVYMAVGKSCVADILGVDATSILAAVESLYKILQEDTEESAPLSTGDAVLPIQDAADLLLRVARRHGYVSGKQAYEDERLVSTSSTMKGYLLESCTPLLGITLQVHPDEYIEAVRNLFSDALEADIENNYLYNMVQILLGTEIRVKDFGMFASSIPKYKKSITPEVEKKTFPEDCCDILATWDFVPNVENGYETIYTAFDESWKITGSFRIDDILYPCSFLLGKNRTNAAEEINWLQEGYEVTMRCRLMVDQRWRNKVKRVGKIKVV